MKNLWIVGAGGFGRELLSWLKQHDNYNKRWTIRGFVDDPLYKSGWKDNPIEKYLEEYKLVSFQEYSWNEDDVFVLAIGNPILKEKIVEEMMRKNVNFLTFIHPSAIIGEFVEIGEGSVIAPNCILSCDIKVGKYVTLNLHSAIGHDCVVGDYTVVSGNCDITGNCIVGKKVFLGTHANLNPGTVIEDESIIGAGSLAMGKVKSGTTVLGVPARKWMQK